jgi:hypothetical protein
MADIEKRIVEEIERYLIQAKETGNMATRTECVRDILRLHPDCALSERQLTDQIIAAAAGLGVALHIDGRSKKG